MSAIIYPAKQATNSLLSSQAAKLHALLRQSSSQAVKQSSSQAATVTHPSCQAAKLSTCCFLTLSSFCLLDSTQAPEYTKKWVQF